MAQELETTHGFSSHARLCTASDSDSGYSNKLEAADGSTSSPYKLSLWIDSKRGVVSKIELQPPEVDVDDIVKQDGCQVSQMSSLVHSSLLLPLLCEMAG